MNNTHEELESVMRDFLNSEMDGGGTITALVRLIELSLIAVSIVTVIGLRSSLICICSFPFCQHSMIAGELDRV